MNPPTRTSAPDEVYPDLIAANGGRKTVKI